MKKFLDCISIVGATPSKFHGTKKYISTGAVATTEIDESEVVEVTYEDRPSRANLSAEAGDILFAKMQGTRKTLLLDSETEKNIYSTGFYAVRANPEVITTECLYYLIDSELFLAQKDKNCSGATQKAITNGGMAKIEISVPPLSEQGILVDKLKHLTQLIADKKKQLNLFDEIIKSRFIELFGAISEEVPLSYYIGGLNAGKSLAGEEENPNKVLKTGAATYDYFDETQIKNLPIGYEPQENHRVKAGDVIISRMNTAELVGAAAYVWDVPEHIYLPDRLWRAEVKETANPIFVWQVLIQSSTKESIRRIASGTSGSMKNISKPGLLGIRVVKAPIKLQEQFAAFVGQVDKSKYHGEFTCGMEVAA